MNLDENFKLTFFDSEKYEKFILGVPFDSTSIDRPGSKYAPNRIRERFLQLESYEPFFGKDADEENAKDIGNLVCVPGSWELTERRMDAALKEAMKKGAVPIVLGGEHLITYSVVKNLKRDCPIIWMDAHSDLREDYEGLMFSHSTVARRIIEDFDREIIFCGCRSYPPEEAAYLKKNKIKIHGVEDLPYDSFDKFYLSLDFDFFDPSIAPGVGTPEHGGFLFSDFVDFVENTKNKKMVGSDIVEVSPLYDHGEITATLAARIMRMLLCA